MNDYDSYPEAVAKREIEEALEGSLHDGIKHAAQTARIMAVGCCTNMNGPDALLLLATLLDKLTA